jgi:hypothetical protein
MILKLKDCDVAKSAHFDARYILNLNLIFFFNVYLNLVVKLTSIIFFLITS